MTHVNLIPIRYRLKRKALAYRRVWIISGIAYLVCLVVVFVFWRALWSNDDRDGSNTIGLLRSDIDNNDKMIDKAARQIADLNVATAELSQISDRPDWGLLLGVIANGCGDQLVLSRCTLSMPAKPAQNVVQTGRAPAAAAAMTIDLQGYGANPKTVTDFALKLEMTGLFENVNIGKTTRELFGTQSATAFTMQCPLKFQGDASFLPSRSGVLLPDKPSQRPAMRRPLTAPNPSTIAGTREGVDQ